MSIGDLALAPFAALWTTPRRFVQTLRNCRDLEQGHWERFPHFSADRAMWCLGYWMWDEAFQKAGRTGKVGTLYVEPQSNAHLFMYSMVSLRIFHVLGALSLPMAMGIWWSSHLMHAAHVSVLWTLLVMALLLCSTSFYGLCFGATNSHAFAFAFLPAALYGLVHEHGAIAVLAWAAMAVFSPPATFLGVVLAGFYTVVAVKAWPLLSTLPAAALIYWIYLQPLVRVGQFQEKISAVYGFLFYKDPAKMAAAQKPSPIFWNYLLLYGQFALISLLFLPESGAPKLLGAFPVLFLSLNTFIRITDLQNVVQLALAVMAATTISAPQPLVLLSFFIAAAPAARYVVFHSRRDVRTTVPVLKPFDIQPIFERLEEFFAPVPEGATVCVAHPDPGDQLSSSGIFTWYYQFVNRLGVYPWYVENLFIYVLWRRSISFFPSNPMLVHSPEYIASCWGRTPEEVFDSMNSLGADYALIYERPDEELEWAAFERAGLARMDSFMSDDLNAYIEYGASPLAPGVKYTLMRRSATA